MRPKINSACVHIPIGTDNAQLDQTMQWFINHVTVTVTFAGHQRGLRTPTVEHVTNTRRALVPATDAKGHPTAAMPLAKALSASPRRSVPRLASQTRRRRGDTLARSPPARRAALSCALSLPGAFLAALFAVSFCMSLSAYLSASADGVSAPSPPPPRAAATVRKAQPSKTRPSAAYVEG